MTKRLSKKVAVVTGGSRGIGKGIIISLVNNGAKVVFLDNDMENGIKTEEEINKKNKKSVIFIKVDVSLKSDNIKRRAIMNSKRYFDIFYIFL